MRIANLAGRATIVTDEGILDVATGSNGAFSSSLDKCIAQLGTLKTWFDAAHPEPSDRIKPEVFARDPRLGAVVTNPQQIFAIGLNYRHHANEMSLTLPSEPMVFTKFASSLCGPNDELPVRGATTDFEAELVVVIGTRSRDVSVEDPLFTAWRATASGRISLSAVCRCVVRRLSSLLESRIGTSRRSDRG
jgi:2,4-diketo-3-deoxy-L-fuconate hydrolase